MELHHFSLRLRLLLGKATILRKELQELEVGDIILLEQNIADPLTCLVEGKPCFSASLGLEGIHKAMKVESLL